MSAPILQGDAWWSVHLATLLDQQGVRSGLDGQAQGLTNSEAHLRLTQVGPNALVEVSDPSPWRLLWKQISGPLVLILVIGGCISLFVGEWMDAFTILAIIVVSAGLGLWQEWKATRAVAALRQRLSLTCRVLRDGQWVTVPAPSLVPGDVIELSAGNLIPADGIIVQARDFLVSEAGLTGESFPVEKHPGVVPGEATLRERTNAVFQGSSVRSGIAQILVMRTGAHTLMADLARRLTAAVPETDFSRGVRHFGDMLMRVMLVVVILVLVANQWLGRPAMDSLLFAMALAVGLSPELLPVIVSVSLARGASNLAALGVWVKRLEAIEDLGTMDVLCTDKTGTLTTGVMTVEQALNPQGSSSDAVMRLGHLNAAFETGIENPLDAALVMEGQRRHWQTDGWVKLDEIPYDFVRRRLTLVLSQDTQPGKELWITKGAFDNVLDVCTQVRVDPTKLLSERGSAAAVRDLDDGIRASLRTLAAAQGQEGLRVLAVATRIRECLTTGPQEKSPERTAADEQAMVFEGLLCFSDPPKEDAAKALALLAQRGIRVKMITGDNRHVAAHVAQAVGLDPKLLLTGEQMAQLREESLWQLAEKTELFVEVDPAQKERIVRALQRTGHAVGYLGDGINDAPALHAADVGLSVEGAVDIARESADVVLMRPDLQVLRRGVEDGRRTFANTLKYIQITTSANFGNMVSMALATPLLPFLPLTATQILLNNFLSDLPSMALSSDRVEDEVLANAQRWNVDQVRRFMITFGLVSSVFDLLTFYLLIQVFQAKETVFHSAWFVVSVLTELAVVLVLRTHRPALQSHPARLLVVATLGVALCVVLLPQTGMLAEWLGLQPLPASVMGSLLAVLLTYVLVTEAVKLWWFAREK